MEKNKLDKFFEEKLAQRKFEFNPEHWEAAEKLIDLQEQDNKRKRFGWWLFLIPLLGLLSYFFFFAKADSPLSLTESEMINTTNQIFENNTSNDNQTIRVPSDNPNQTDKEEINKTTATKNDFSTLSIPINVETKNVTATANPESLNSSFPNTRENENTTATKTTATKVASSAVETKMKKGNSRPEQSEFNVNSILLTSPDSTSENIKQTKAPKLDQASNNPGPATNDENEEPFVSTTDEAVAISNTLLNVPALAASLNDLADQEKGKPTSSDRLKKFDIGLMAGTLFYSSDRESVNVATNKTETLKNYKIGFSGGLTFGYRFSPHFSLNADALYQWRKEDFGTVYETDGESFSFGRISTVTTTQPKAFHSIEVPLYLHYNIGRHSLEAGASFRYLLAIQGINKSTSETVLPAENSVEENDGLLNYSSNVWIPEDNYERFTTSYILGYRYWINDRFNVGLRATYTPSAKSFSGNADLIAGRPNSNISTQTNKLNFNLSAKWYFNKRNPYKRL